MLMVNGVIERVNSVQRTPEEVTKILAQLRRPFSAEEVKWKPQATKNDNGKKTGQAAAYADPRSYTDRLNQVVGPEGWFSISETLFSPPFEKGVSEWTGASGQRQKTTTFRPVCKLITTVSVGILGIGFKTNVGEEWADDDNAHTSSFAQALKRAVSEFGLGRYFYDLPKQWADLNDKGFFVHDPVLPEWALPYYCADGCGEWLVDAKAPNGTIWVPHQVIYETKKRFGKDLCMSCWAQADAAAKAAAATKQPNGAAQPNGVPVH
jgi:hypothetical protein